MPPGSIFKMVTATNVLESGAATPNIDGQLPGARSPWTAAPFTNSESEALGKVPLLTDFAKSCNTAFASLYSEARHQWTGDAPPSSSASAATWIGRRADTFTGSVADDGAPSTRPRPRSDRARPWSARWRW